MKRLNIALVGCGAAAEIFHIPALISIPEFKIDHLVDVNLERANKVARKFGLVCKTETNYKKILDDANLEAVFVLTPPRFHEKIVIASLENGKHVFCEKPFSINSVSGKKMANAAKANNTKLMVGFHMRFIPQYRKIKELIERGFFGELIGGYFTHFANVYEWPSVSGFQIKTDEGGALFEMGCHHVDLMYWFFGYPKKLKAKILNLDQKCPVDDAACVYAEFEKASCTLNIGWNKLDINNIAVFGTHAYATCSENRNEVLYFRKDLIAQSPIRIKVAKSVSPYRSELSSFYKCIKDDVKPEVSAEDALSVTKIVEKAYKSSNLDKLLLLED